MSIDTSKLEKVRELPGGIVQARCPACAEGNHDRTGEHLRIYPDGRFGCCVHPKDGEHRKRIFALAGSRKPGTFTVRIKAPAAPTAMKSVKAALSPTPKQPLDNSRTPRTGIFELRARAREDSVTPLDIGGDVPEKLKDLETPVRGVRTGNLPYLTPGGTLVIPFDSPERYHWWKQGQSVAATLAEIRARLGNQEGGHDAAGI